MGPDVLLELGFRYDSSVFPVKDSLYGMPDAERFPYVIREKDGRRLVEFPITTTELFGRNLPLGGGGYLRLLPYVYMKWGMRRVNRRGAAGHGLLHPPVGGRSRPPRMKTAGRRGFSSHYVNLGGTEAKLRRLLRDFRFAPMRDCSTSRENWECLCRDERLCDARMSGVSGSVTMAGVFLWALGAMAYVYVGYPLLLFLVASVAPGTPPPITPRSPW